MKTLFALALVLFGVSLPPNVLALREMLIDSSVRSRYAVRSAQGSLEVRLGNAHVRLSDDAPASTRGEARFRGPVRISVNGREYGIEEDVEVRPAYTDANRYWGFLHLFQVDDEKAGRPFLAVAQRIGGAGYRVLQIDGDGRVIEDRFSYAERCSPPLRALLIRTVVPHPSGYCSDVMTSYPSLFYPLLYPWVSGAAGALGTVWAGAALIRRRRSHAR